MSAPQQSQAMQAPQVSVPELSMPKGGGALAGLSRAIDRVGMTGEASMSLPLPISPGRGFAPSLGLAYQSNSGNGLFGMGWHLGVPSIARRTSKGVPAYADDDEIMGPTGEPLVRYLDDHGKPVEDRVTHFCGDALPRPYTVARFRPRIEGDFSRLERWTPADSSQGGADSAPFWLLRAADGTMHLYGMTAAARVADPADPSVRIARWLLEESVSPTGEHVVYDYAAENDAGLDDIGRQRDHAAQRYLRRVRYGNLAAARQPYLLFGGALPEHWHFEFVLDYGERPSGADAVPAVPPYAAPGPWALREDSYSDYSAGFEIRTHRLCRQALMFHYFPQEGLGDTPALVQRMVFDYDTSPFVTLLRSARTIGHGVNGQTLATPPVEFTFADFELTPDASGYRPFEALTGLDDGVRYQLVDLYGEGIAGVLYRDPTGWRYRAPERASGDSVDPDAIAYGPWQALPHQPAGQAGAANMLLADITGNGQLDWVVTQPGMAGFFTRQPNGEWSDFAPFTAFPTEFLHPQGALASLFGAGLTDLALIGPRSVRLYVNEREKGFAAPQDVNHEGAALPIPGAARDELVAFSDVLGSGQAHLVRVRHDGIDCWPNLGRGRFGAPIKLATLPFSAAEFAPSNVFFADLDGSGAADLIVAKTDGLLIFRNRAGNGFDAPVTLPLPEGVRYDPLCRIGFADVDGLGCASLVLSTPHGGEQNAPRHWRYDFVGRKPYLLERVNNNLGMRSHIGYRSSAQEWLDEKRDDSAAVCRLPFVMHVVSRSEQHDEISGSTLVQRLQYRHGFYDGIERELRGFGRVQSTDCESFIVKNAAENAAQTTEDFVPPVLTTTWYHTGDPDAAAPAGAHDPLTLGPPGPTLVLRMNAQGGDDVIGTFDEIDCATRHELARALKGTTLRVEVHGLDGSDRQHLPYSVALTRHAVRLVQPRAGQRYSVVLPIGLEQISCATERVPDDPVCAHAITLAQDAYGLPTHAVSVTYPRNASATCPLPEGAPEALWWHAAHDAQQRRWLVSETRQAYRHVTEGDVWRLGLPHQARANALEFAADSFDGAVSYEMLKASPHVPDGWLAPSQPRIAVAQNAVHYVEHNGQPHPAALVAYTEQAVLHDEALNAYAGWLDGDALKAALKDVGYVAMTPLLPEESSVTWWGTRSGATVYADASGFYRPLKVQPVRSRGATKINYDAYVINVTEVEDAAGLKTRAVYDYRHMAPMQITDAQGNVQEAAYDALGQVRLASFYGTEQGQKAGFAPVAGTAPPIVTPSDALADPAAALGNAAAFTCHDLFSWMTRRVPVHSVTLAASRYPDDDGRQIAVSIAYTDGFGRALQAKQRYEPGDAYRCDGRGGLRLDNQGQPEISHAEARWAVTGRVEYNNKGMPVRTYQPYFIDTSGVVDDAALRATGLFATHWYDALGREMRVRNAIGTWRRVTHWPWYSVAEDENDLLGLQDLP